MFKLLSCQLSFSPPTQEPLYEGFSFLGVLGGEIADQPRMLRLTQKPRFPQEDVDHEQNGDDQQQNPRRHYFGEDVPPVAGAAESVAAGAEPGVTSNDFEANTFPSVSFTSKVHDPVRP